MKLLGKVVDNNDTEKLWRIKVEVPGYSQGIEIENLEWYEQKSTTIIAQSQLPNIDEWVELDMYNKPYPTWSHLDMKDRALVELLGDDYIASIVFCHRNLEKQGSEGLLHVTWTKTNGYVIKLNDAQIQLSQEDGSILLDNNERRVHLQGDHLSLGSVDKSAEPSVMGDQNFEALNQLNDNWKSSLETVSASMKTLGSTAAANPYTVALAPLFTKLASELDTLHIVKEHTTTKNHIPKTKSKLTSLD